MMERATATNNRQKDAPHLYISISPVSRLRRRRGRGLHGAKRATAFSGNTLAVIALRAINLIELPVLALSILCLVERL